MWVRIAKKAARGRWVRCIVCENLGAKSERDGKGRLLGLKKRERERGRERERERQSKSDTHFYIGGSSHYLTDKRCVYTKYETSNSFSDNANQAVQGAQTSHLPARGL